MTVRSKRSLIALLISVLMLLSLFTVEIFAENEPDTDASSTQQSESVKSDESAKETEAESEADSAKENESETVAETTQTPAEEETTNHTELIVNLVIGGIILALAIFLIIKNRKKLMDFLRSVKSELKKIVWSSKEQTRKNFLVVIVICVAVAILVAVLDLAFRSGIEGLASLFSKK